MAAVAVTGDVVGSLTVAHYVKGYDPFVTGALLLVGAMAFFGAYIMARHRELLSRESLYAIYSQISARGSDARAMRRMVACSGLDGLFYTAMVLGASLAPAGIISVIMLGLWPAAYIVAITAVAAIHGNQLRRAPISAPQWAAVAIAAAGMTVAVLSESPSTDSSALRTAAGVSIAVIGVLVCSANGSQYSLAYKIRSLCGPLASGGRGERDQQEGLVMLTTFVGRIAVVAVLVAASTVSTAVGAKPLPAASEAAVVIMWGALIGGLSGGGRRLSNLRSATPLINVIGYLSPAVSAMAFTSLGTAKDTSPVILITGATAIVAANLFLFVSTRSQRTQSPHRRPSTHAAP